MTELKNEATEFLDGLNHPLRAEIELLRHIILNSNIKFKENIKWNGPNYSYENEDRITMRIHPFSQLQLIFHRGAKKQIPSTTKLINDKSEILKWKENDRAIATFKSIEEIKNAEIELKKIIQFWIIASSINN